MASLYGFTDNRETVADSARSVPLAGRKLTMGARLPRPLGKFTRRRSAWHYAVLNRYDDFVTALRESGNQSWKTAFVLGEMYCPGCGAPRRLRVHTFFVNSRAEHWSPDAHSQATLTEYLPPSLFLGVCVQCDAKYTFLVHLGPDGPDLVVIPFARGGLATPHTPPGVGYYLDQAQRAESVGARSAAIAMYRGRAWLPIHLKAAVLVRGPYGALCVNACQRWRVSEVVMLIGRGRSSR